MTKLTPFDVFSEALAKEKAQRGLPRLSEGGPPVPLYLPPFTFYHLSMIKTPVF